MINGITWHGMHSQLDFGATLIERDTNFPEKERITERVPYSSVTYDFTELYGKASYPERELKYKFVISDERGIHYLKKRVDKFKKWLYNPISKSELYEDKETEYHFKAVCTQITENYTHPVKCEITVTFKADPYRMPSVPPERTAIPISDCRYPDIDGDGRVTAADASMILEAAANIGAGHPSGLTPEQELLADTNRDGIIDATDAAFVQQFVAQCGAGIWTDSESGWTDFINYNLDKMSEVL